jgi:hypothetical protein
MVESQKHKGIAQKQWWLMPVIPLGRLRLEDGGFKASLSYLVKLRLKKKRKKKRYKREGRRLGQVEEAKQKCCMVCDFTCVIYKREN